MAFSKIFLSELESRSNMTDLASAYVNLQKRGRNYVGLCPFHNEKTASFNIYPETNSFYCFGCNAGGGVIEFVKRIENLDFTEAVRFLAQRAGISLPEDGYDDSLSKLRTRVLEVNRETARFFYSKLKSPEGKRALDYLTSRKLSVATIKRFGLGYSPSGGFELVNHLKAKGFTQNEMVQANVASVSKNGNPYDRFRGRVMFPIIDLRGNVIAFGGRILTDEKPKYINTSDTLVYRKSRELFALNFAKDSGERSLILAEGYMDVISLHQAGFTNTVASLGTSLTEEQAKVMSRYADEVVLCYDSDEAGQRASRRAIPILKKANLYVKVLAVPGNKDPDEFISSHGEEGPLRFKALIEGAGSDVEYKLHKAKEKYDLESTDGLTRYIREASEVIADIENSLEADICAGKLARETGVEKQTILKTAETVRGERNKGKRREERREQNRVIAGSSVVNKDKSKNPRVANAEEGIISYLFKRAERIHEIHRQLPPERFETAYNRKIYELLYQMKDYQSISMSDFSDALTADEMAELSRIIHSHTEPAVTSRNVKEYIDVINNEVNKLGTDKIKEASLEEIEDLLRKIKKEKQGER